VQEKVIQRILRQANVSTTANYYIRTSADNPLLGRAGLHTQARPVREHELALMNLHSGERIVGHQQVAV
jgi:hypothetical protein